MKESWLLSHLCIPTNLNFFSKYFSIKMFQTLNIMALICFFWAFTPAAALEHKPRRKKEAVPWVWQDGEQFSSIECQDTPQGGAGTQVCSGSSTSTQGPVWCLVLWAMPWQEVVPGWGWEWPWWPGAHLGVLETSNSSSLQTWHKSWERMEGLG